MKKFVVLGLVGLTIITSCKDPHKELVEKVKESVKASLKDPESARFGEIDIFPLLDGQIACGTVNSKNTYGGYVGSRLFRSLISPDGTVRTDGIANDEKMNLINQFRCDFEKKWGAKPGNSGKTIAYAKYKELEADEGTSFKSQVLPALFPELYSRKANAD